MGFNPFLPILAELLGLGGVVKQIEAGLGERFGRIGQEELLTVGAGDSFCAHRGANTRQSPLPRINNFYTHSSPC